jgi:hypothetical protein
VDVKLKTKMRVIIRNGLFLAILLTIAMTSCQKADNNDGKGEGVLKFNGIEYSISGASLSEVEGYYGAPIKNLAIFNDAKSVLVIIKIMETELTSKVYTSINILQIDFAYDFSPVYYGDENFVMVVKKTGNNYDITITGKTRDEELDYTITYKGSIQEQQPGKYYRPY